MGVARWLSDGLIVVTGDDRWSGRGRRTCVAPFGVRLIDTTRWRISLLDARPLSIASVGNQVLATGRRGVGVRFPGEDVSVYGVHARRAYVWVRRTRAVHTLDVGRGRSIHVR